MTGAFWLLLLVTAQRSAELVYARRNEARLRAAGAIEVGAAHYPVIVLMHAAWLAAAWVFGVGRALDPAWVVAYLGLQGLRFWVLATLGRRWSTRVFVLPGEHLVRRGPYRFVSHPNYAVVAAEMFVLPLALHLPWLAIGFGLLDLGVLAWRIRVENRALVAFTAPGPGRASAQS